jgi:hypothetical protein
MAYKIKFTQDLIESLRFTPRLVGMNNGAQVTEPVPASIKDYFISDLSNPGFELRMTRGCKTYYIRRMHDSRQYLLKVGDAQVVSLKNARAEGDRLLGLISQGKDPKLMKKTEKELRQAKEDRERFLFSVAFEDYRNHRQEGNQFAKKTKNDHRQIANLMGKSQLWKTPFDEITPAIIEDALKPLYFRHARSLHHTNISE